jgi:hypothetical protein
MTRAARSTFVFGLYLFGIAGILITAPNILFGLVGIASTTEPWARVLGVLVAVLGAYYILAARSDFAAFFRTSVWLRLVVLAAFVGLVAVGWAPAPLIIFGVVDAIGALWTWTALRSAV